jgi:hypothetical protein
VAFCWTEGTVREGDLPHLPRQWPQWPVDLVTVRPGDADPWVEGRDQARHQRYAAGYDVREPGLHPFDWTSLLALADTLEAGMPSMGHVPIGYVHEFDDAADITLIEIPTGHLLNWMFSDCHHLVLTMKKPDLAAGNWDRVLLQLTN